MTEPARREGHPAGATLGPTADTDNSELEVEAGATSRVVFFSDAVVAIAITLLALALPLPHSTGSTTNRELLPELAGQWDSYLAFVISFVAIGYHWAAHRRVFRHVIRVNHRIGQLTLLWLLMVVLTPVAARLLAGSGGFGVRFTLYALIQIIAWVCLVLMGRLVIHDNLLRPDAPETARHPDNVTSYTVIAIFALSIPIAFCTAWAFALWAAIPVLTRGSKVAPGGRAPDQDDRVATAGQPAAAVAEAERAELRAPGAAGAEPAVQDIASLPSRHGNGNVRLL